MRLGSQKTGSGSGQRSAAGSRARGSGWSPRTLQGFMKTILHMMTSVQYAARAAVLLKRLINQ